jgi:hypothetical protein
MAKVLKVRKGDVGLVVLKVSVPAEVAKALRLEAVGRACTVSQVIERMVALAPTRFVLTERSRGAGGPKGQESPSAAPGEVLPFGPVSSEVA